MKIGIVPGADCRNRDIHREKKMKIEEIAGRFIKPTGRNDNSTGRNKESTGRNDNSTGRNKISTGRSGKN